MEERADSRRAGRSPRGGGSLLPRPTYTTSPSPLPLNPYRQDQPRWVPNPRLSSGSCRERKVDWQERTEKQADA